MTTRRVERRSARPTPSHPRQPALPVSHLRLCFALSSLRDGGTRPRRLPVLRAPRPLSLLLFTPARGTTQDTLGAGLPVSASTPPTPAPLVHVCPLPHPPLSFIPMSSLQPPCVPFSIFPLPVCLAGCERLIPASMCSPLSRSASGVSAVANAHLRTAFLSAFRHQRCHPPSPPGTRSLCSRSARPSPSHVKPSRRPPPCTARTAARLPHPAAVCLTCAAAPLRCPLPLLPISHLLEGATRRRGGGRVARWHGSGGGVHRRGAGWADAGSRWARGAAAGCRGGGVVVGGERRERRRQRRCVTIPTSERATEEALVENL